MDIHINGLTSHQTTLLDRMWEIKEVDEFNAWFVSLNESTRAEVESLIEILCFEIKDATMSNRYTEANAVLSQFRLE